MTQTKSERRRTHSSPGSSDASASQQLSKDKYRLVVMGAAEVGKTCLVSRFLYHEFISQYKATVEEFHSGEYEINGRPLTLDILDTTGSYEFPAMRRLSIATGDAFILVYSVDDPESFEEVKMLRQQILEAKDSQNEVSSTPIVIVGNKADLSKPPVDPTQRATMETTVSIDWGHGYVEASAKDDINIGAVFRELLAQAKISLGDEPVIKRHGSLRRSKSSKKNSKDNSRHGKRNSANCVIS